MQKTKNNTQNTEPEISEKDDLRLAYQVDAEETSMVRTYQNGLGKRNRSRGRLFVASTGINPTLLIIYGLLILIGLYLGRWLYNRDHIEGNTAVAATEPAAEVSAASSSEPITSSGFVCPPAQSNIATVSTELNMLVWTEYLPIDWFECFEMRYGIKINRTEFSSNEEMLQIFAENPGKFDLLQPSDQGVTTLIGEKGIQALDKNALTVINNFNPAFMNPPYDPGNKYSLPYQAGSIALAVNGAKIDPLPKAWGDLWKAEYANRILLMEDANDVIGITLLSEGYPFNSTDPAQLEAIKPKLADLFRAAKTLNSDSQSTDILNGDIDLGLFWNGEAALAQRENNSIQYVYPTEGAILWQDNYTIAADASHADAAYAWINYTMQGDMFWMMLRDFPYTNPNQAALDFAKTNHPELYKEYINSPVTNIPAQAVLNGHWLIDLGESQALYDQLWSEMLATQQ